MGNTGHTAQGTRGTTRPRAWCPGCKRSIAVTFNRRTGEACLRTHTTGTPGERCRWSTGTVPPGRPLHEKGDTR